MPSDDDLDAAVGAGIVTQAQADALRTFSRQRQASGAGERADEERFRFMRGFNDFFFAVGVVLLGSGLSMFAGMYANPVAYGLAAGIMWALAELLVRRMRLVLPGIVIVIYFVIFAVLALPVTEWLGVTQRVPSSAMIRGYVLATMFSGGSISLAIKAAIVCLSAAAFYARFRFPFALLIFGGGAVSAFALVVRHFMFDDSQLAGVLILLLCGLVVFGFAMWFDLSDRLRVTRRSDCAFWLHVLAAPLLVHSLVGLVSNNAFSLDRFAASMIVVIAVLFTIVALIVDRRALLVSALVYVGSAIAFALTNAAVSATFVAIATLVILGALVLALGVGWSPLRRVLMSFLPPALVSRLPPVIPV